MVGVSILFLLAGCSNDIPIAPVSGTVFLNGKPLPHAHVVFQPVGTRENPNPGRGSYGATDERGRFTLKYDGGSRTGAVVGRHTVAIATILEGEGTFDPETGSPDGEPVEGKERIPARYNDKTILTFDVPPGGTDKAEFRLTAP
jgi:hypothetical protein